MKEKGLTSEEVLELTKQGKTNYVKNKASKSSLEIVCSCIFTYFNGIFAFLSILIIISGSFKSLIFLPVIIINILIGIYQQIKSKRILDKLALLDNSKYTVIRDGKEEIVISNNLVLGDIVKLESGDQIPADAEVVEGTASVNESLLTGESDEIDKVIGSELKSGSFVVSGKIYARLTHVGEDSYVSKLSSEAKKIKEKQSEMIHDIEKIIRIAGVVIIPIGAILLYQSMVVNGESFRDAVPAMVGAITGMIPEGLYLLVTVALALSAARLAKKKVLLHDMKSIETLARVDVLCVDKTGTITSSIMDVTDVFGRVDEDEKELKEAKDILSKYVNTVPDNNATMLAMQKYFKSKGTLDAKEVIPFDSKKKYSQVVIKKDIYKLGAPEFLMSKKDLDKNNNIIELYTSMGKRVLTLVKNDKPIIFIALQNELRENAKETFSYFESQGITIKVISGDNPLTVSKIAEKASIANADKYIAMGEGSDAARSAAQVVLLDSDFSHMKDIVFEGRRNINNITRSATLFLYKNMFSLLLAVFSIVASFSYPLKSTQIAIISFFNIGLPAFLLTFEPNTKKQEGLFIKNVFINALPAALTSFTAVLSMMHFAGVFNIPNQDFSTACIYLISVVGFNILWLITRPINNYHRIIFLICIIGILSTSSLLGNVFDMRNISIKSTSLCMIFAFAEMSVIKDISYLLNQIDLKILKRINKDRYNSLLKKPIESQ